MTEAMAARAASAVSKVAPDDWRPGSLAGDPVLQALADIRHLTRAASLHLALDVGEIVFHRIFGGSAARVRRRGPKDASFRRLALHPELPMSASNLWRAVAIYELSLRVPALRRSPRLGVSHARAVLGLPPSSQASLIARADAESWTVTRLSEEAARRRTGRGGRPRKAEVERVLETLRRLSALPATTLLDKDAIARMSSEDVEVGLVTLRELSGLLAELARELRRVSAKR